MKLFPVAGGRSVSFALFSDVSNSRELLDLMQSGKVDPEAAFLNASLILSVTALYFVSDVFPVLVAAHKALLSKSREALTTRTLHSELVTTTPGRSILVGFGFQISESLKRCGIADDTQYILTARFDASDEEMKALEKLISGTEIDLSELETRANQPKILKQFKITPQELSISTLPEAIVCRIAARDAL